MILIGRMLAITFVLTALAACGHDSSSSSEKTDALDSRVVLPPPATLPTDGLAPSPDVEPCTATQPQVAVTPVQITVEGEPATGRLYEPYICQPGDLAPTQLIVFAHGHTDTAASFADILEPLARDTATPLLTMDHRSEDSQWQPGAWNVWAGWQDTVAATEWYRTLYPSIEETVLWGWSQGGTTSGLALAYGPEGLYDWWVASFPIANAFVAWLAGAAVDQTMREEIERDAGNCTPLACPQAYIARSPELLANKIKPTHRAVILHGLFDTTVPVEESIRLQLALTLTGTPVSAYTIATDRDAEGNIVPAGHGVGPVALRAADVVRRIIAHEEPDTLPLYEYFVDASLGIDTGPSVVKDGGVP